MKLLSRFLAVLLFTATLGTSAHERPNILFILADDLGWMDTGFMGSTYFETPNLDKLAADSMVFTQAYAGAANCAPSRACLMSGQQSPRHGIYTVSPSDRGNTVTRKLIPTKNVDHLYNDAVTIAEVLQGLGIKPARPENGILETIPELRASIEILVAGQPAAPRAVTLLPGPTPFSKVGQMASISPTVSQQRLSDG